MEQRPVPLVRLCVLGEFRILFDGDELRVSAPARRLLAQLAVLDRDRPATRPSAAERLWPESPPGRASSSLRSVLWRLPRPRGRTLVTCTATDIRLSPDVEVDLWRAERLAERLCAAPEPAQQVGDDPGSGPPAGDVLDVTPLTRDLLAAWPDDWLLVEREAWRQQRLHALEECARAWRDRGRYPEALTAGLGAVRAEPLRESAHRRVIEVHLAEGNHAEALRQYDAYRHLLAQELGLRPSPAIRRLIAPLLGRPLDSA